MHVMSEVVQALFFTFAVVCFLVAAFKPDLVARVNLVALGLAAFVLVACWNAWALS